MGRILVLILLALLALGSLSGYLILNKLILSGSMKIAAGQVQIAQGEKKLATGKARLASGERELSSGKKTFGGAAQAPLLAAAALFPPSLIATVAGREVVNKKLAQGDREVAEGKKKVRAGEKQLAVGKLELDKGIERLSRAKWIRTTCACGFVIFASLLLLLTYFWRKSLIKRKIA